MKKDHKDAYVNARFDKKTKKRLSWLVKNTYLSSKSAVVRKAVNDMYDVEYHHQYNKKIILKNKKKKK